MSNDETFRRLDREVLIDNAWHRYCRDRYVHPDGSEGTYYYIDMVGSCASIPVFDDGTMVLDAATTIDLNGGKFDNDDLIDVNVSSTIELGGGTFKNQFGDASPGIIDIASGATLTITSDTAGGTILNHDTNGVQGTISGGGFLDTSDTNVTFINN